MKLQGDLARDNVAKLLLTLSIPPMIGMTVQALYNVVDTFWVGKLGPEAIAALTICFPIQLLLIAIASGTGIGLTSLIARRLGENKDKEAVNISIHGLIMILVYAIFIGGPALLYLNEILFLFGASPELLPICQDYIKIILMGSFFLFFAIMSGSIIQAEGNSGTPMKSMLTGAIINIVLDPFLIFGIGPFPEMGVSGAALATFIAQIGSSAVNFIYIFFKQGQLKISLSLFKFNFSLLADIYKVGMPSMIIQLINVLMFVILNFLARRHGILAIGAVGIYFRIESLLFMPVNGLIQGLLPVAGFAYGAQNLERIKLSVKYASIISAIIMSIGFLAFQLIPGPLITAFNDNPGLVDVGISCMRNISLLLPLVGPAIMMTTAFQATGRGITALILSLLRQLVFLFPSFFILPHYLGLRGVWLAFPLSDFFGFIISAGILIRYLKKLEENGFTDESERLLADKNQDR